MRTFTKTAIALLLSLTPHAASSEAAELARHSDTCGPGCKCNEDSVADVLGLFYCGKVKTYGWLDAGIIGNSSSPDSKFNGPYNAVDRSNEVMLNQIYLVAERELPKCGHGFGGRMDIMYGEDFLLAESLGREKRSDGRGHWNNQYYGIATPQGFVSAGNQRLSFQLGHFYSVVGYEGVMAPDNFFYSKSYSYQFAGPFTHWGGQMNWNPNNALSVQLGLHNGWDAFDRVSDSVGFVGKVRYDSQSSGHWTSFAITTGDDYNDMAGVAPTQDFTNRTRYSWLVGLPLTCKLDYVFHHWLGVQENGAPSGGQATWYGIDQYLAYAVNDCTKVGFRFEWFRDDDGTRVGLNRTSNPNSAPFIGDFYSLSFGANWAPNDRLIVRPELRSDWFDGASATRPYNDASDDDQFTFGFDVILRI